MLDYKSEYLRWLNSEYTDESTKNELQSIANNETEIKERFYRHLEFGTAGIRGILGAGTNRMNIYIVRRVTQGLANFICAQGEQAKQRGVAISYDSRIKSDVFANEAACVLAANGIKCYLSNRLRPVPMLSFAIRYFNALNGIIITASHNPPEHNGYKVYGEDGGQLNPADADKVLEEIEKIDFFGEIKTCSVEEGISKGLIVMFGENLDNAYYEKTLAERINPEAVRIVADDFKLVYTPIHGSGNIPVRKILDMSGFKNVLVVKEQEEPNGNFPTVKSPNPEYKETLEMAIDLAKSENIDLVIGTDPDSDRMGIAVRDSDREYQALSGNMVGALLIEYILANLSASGELPKNAVIMKSIVSTKMVDAICSHYGVETVDVYTGFKFFAEKIKEYEKLGDKKYLFGFEESYGYLLGTHVRDKDAISASMITAEMAAWYKLRGMTLYDGLLEIYKKYGTYRERLIQISLEGIEGSKRIQRIMAQMRNNPPETVAGIALEKYTDHLTGVRKNVITDRQTRIDMIPSDVLVYELENGSWFAARPSGTEPKIKFYLGTKSSSINAGEAALDDLEAYIRSVIDSVE
ncbi:MAG: phospho-sugar mutase [Monoglobales bacterium]